MTIMAGREGVRLASWAGCWEELGSAEWGRWPGVLRVLPLALPFRRGGGDGG